MPFFPIFSFSTFKHVKRADFYELAIMNVEAALVLEKNLIQLATDYQQISDDIVENCVTNI